VTNRMLENRYQRVAVMIIEVNGVTCVRHANPLDAQP
jgi:hypothetical protein